MLQSETFFMHHHPQSVMSKMPQNVSEWLWRLFTCNAVHVYTAATEESEHCHLAFRVLPMGRCGFLQCTFI